MPVRHLVTNRVANPAMRRLLRWPAGRLLGRHLAVIRYTGARTGQVRELVAGYARAGDTAWIWVGDAGTKRWWRNFRTPADVELWLGGEHVRGRGRAVEGGTDPDECREGVAAYVAGVPGAARVMRLPAEPEALRPEDLRDVVMVRVALTP
ncbi:nitroreductase/quinone reductase family protein [Geodermatophilus sp. URMC 64]